jgi:ABC-type Fe3+-hydroxamate transport system substrate-binding protein
MADEDLRAELERLRKENEALKQAPKSRVSMKVSDKGGLSVYGLGRFPVTLYKEQWTKLISMSADIERFIREHDHELKTKE